MWCLCRIAGHISPAAVAACTKCQCSAEAAQLTQRRSQNAALSEKRVCRSQGLRGQWPADATIDVLACQNQPIQLECLRCTLKRTQIASLSIYKPESSNSARQKVNQDEAWKQRKLVHTSVYHHRVCAMLNMKNAHVCSTGLPRTRSCVILRAVLPELRHAIGAFNRGKS